jgi:hypothetical protein
MATWWSTLGFHLLWSGQSSILPHGEDFGVFRFTKPDNLVKSWTEQHLNDIFLLKLWDLLPLNIIQLDYLTK